MSDNYGQQPPPQPYPGQNPPDQNPPGGYPQFQNQQFQNPPAGYRNPSGSYAPATSEDYPGKTMGIVGLILAFFFSIAGWIVSAIALKQSKDAGVQNTPAKIGLILSIIFTIGGVILAIILIISAITLATSVHNYSGY